MTSTRQFFCFATAIALTACGNPADEGSRQNPIQEVAEEEPVADETAIEVIEIMPGLTMRMLREGTGETAEPGQIAVVHYTGWLYDETAEDHHGVKFDSSVDRGVHFEFPLGAGRVIRGWDEGVAGMKIGEVRELTIAPELAYGNRRVGAAIPPGSTLVFEVELADVKVPEAETATP